MVNRDNGLFTGAGAALFLNEKHSDVSLFVKWGMTEIRFPVHSLFLISVSRVLSAMLAVNLREKSTRQIVIEDSTPVAVKEFLRFLYTGEMKLFDWREYMDLLYLAHKYEVSILVKFLEEQLVTHITLANVCPLHEIAQLYSLKSLLLECQKLITEGAFVILKTESFKSMSQNSVKCLISNRSLNVEDENFVFEAIRLWAASECCRQCKELTPDNIIEILEPLLDGINLDRIPDEKKSFLPASVLENHRGSDIGRVSFFVPGTLQKHMVSLRYVVELGSFAHRMTAADPLTFVKFSVDDYLYLVGFRIVGMFRTNMNFGITSPQLILSRDDSKSTYAHFNLNSIPWKCGSISGDYIWKEMVAFFPQPAKIVVNCAYSLTLSCANIIAAKWPKTRLESKAINTVLGKMNFFCLGECTGITELFLLPAPSDCETFRHTLES